MKYTSLLILFLCSLTTQAQNYRKVIRCIIEKGVLKNVETAYDPATGNSYVSVNGALQRLEAVYPANSKDYANNNAWFKSADTITVAGVKYSRGGFPYILEVPEVRKIGSYNNVGVYMELANKKNDIAYLPTREGCEFQPYRKVEETTTQKKIFYADYGLVSSEKEAAFYRLVTLDAKKKPVGMVQEFYITGEKHWEGRLRHLDPYDMNRDTLDGHIVWYYKNGKKEKEQTWELGKMNGTFSTWNENAVKESEINFQAGKLNGSYKTWFANGKPKEIRQYAQGLLHGKLIHYLPDGRISMEQTYDKGLPATACTNELREDKSVYEICVDPFNSEKPVYKWTSIRTPGSSYHQGSSSVEIASQAGSKAILFTRLAFESKNLESIQVQLSANSEADDAEYGLAWNIRDSANFYYFVLSKNGWWSAGSFVNGKRRGLTPEGVIKMNSGKYWNEEGKQIISVSRFEDGIQLWLNNELIYSFELHSSFSEGGVGLVSLNQAAVKFARFEVIRKK